MRSDPKLVRFRCQLIAYLKFGSHCFDDEVGFIIFWLPSRCPNIILYYVRSPRSLSFLAVILSAHSLLSDDSLYVFRPSSSSSYLEKLSKPFLNVRQRKKKSKPTPLSSLIPPTRHLSPKSYCCPQSSQHLLGPRVPSFGRDVMTSRAEDLATNFSDIVTIVVTANRLPFCSRSESERPTQSSRICINGSARTTHGPSASDGQ